MEKLAELYDEAKLSDIATLFGADMVSDLGDDIVRFCLLKIEI